jgi:nitroreductase
MEAARWAPSCFGAEPWRFVLCDKERNPAAWQKALDCLVPDNQTWAQQAAALILVCADTAFAHNGKSNTFHAYDTGAAAMCLVLEAENQGLRAHQMGGFDAEAARAAFAVPQNCACLSFIAVGKQAEAATLKDDDMRAREETPRQRQALVDNFFDGAWSVPVKVM